MKIKMGDSAVSEIIGTILLLAIAVSTFSIVYMNVLSDTGPDSASYATVVGKIENNQDFFDVIFEHQRGESLGPDTEVVLNIAGPYGDSYHMAVNDGSLIDPVGASDGWNIGERLVYHPTENLDDVQIKANIFDKETNSLVFWGMLQDGYVVPPFGRGGLWHFDETSWDGTSGEVKDASGNENHGTAKNGAYIVDADAISGNCGYFDGLDDYVEVKSVYSLNITDAVTIEAWVKPLEETSIISDTHLEGLKFGYNPDFININNDTYAVTARDYASQDCAVITFNVSSDGTVSLLDPSVPNNRTVFCQKGDKPNILNHTQNSSLYIIVYENGTQSKGAICTLNIADNGSISGLIGELVYNESECFDPKVVHISDDVYAIVYHSGPENKPGVGVLTTVTIDSSGSIAKIGDFTFNDTGCYTPSISHVSGDVYSIAYRGSDNTGVITTVDIDPSGSIIKIGDFAFNESGCFMPSVVNVSDNVFATIYHGPNKQPGFGILTTVNIADDGSVSTIQDLIFTDNCFEPKITNYGSNEFLIIFNDADNNGDGFLKTVTIEPDGTIIDTAEPWQPEFLTDALHEPSDIIHMGGRLFGLAFRYKAEGSGHPGHVMCLALGEDPTPTYMRGIVRAGAATIYAQYQRGSNMVNILGCVNGPDQMIVGEVTPNQWHHIVLTYDREYIRLYANLQLVDEMSYNEKISIPPNNLLFGNIFYGYLDEIAIFDRALEFSEFEAHYNTPGYFVEEPIQ